MFQYCASGFKLCDHAAGVSRRLNSMSWPAGVRATQLGYVPNSTSTSGVTFDTDAVSPGRPAFAGRDTAPLNPKPAHPAHIVAEIHLIAHQFGAMDHRRVIGKLHPFLDHAGLGVVPEKGIQIGIRR